MYIFSNENNDSKSKKTIDLDCSTSEGCRLGNITRVTLCTEQQLFWTLRLRLRMGGVGWVGLFMGVGGVGYIVIGGWGEVCRVGVR